MKGTKRNLLYLLLITLMIIIFVIILKQLPLFSLNNKKFIYFVIIQLILLLLLALAFLFVALKGILYFFYENKKKVLGKRIRTKFFNIIFLIVIIISLPFSAYQIFFTNYLFKKWGGAELQVSVNNNLEFSKYLISGKAKQIFDRLKQFPENPYPIYSGNIKMSNNNYIYNDGKIIVNKNGKYYYSKLDAKEISFIEKSRKNYEKFLYDVKFRKKASKYFLIISIIIMFIFLFVLAFWIAGYFGKDFIASIDNLLQGTNELKNGNFDFKINKISSDELGTLTDRFNEMVNIIKINQEKLRAERDYQMELFTLLTTPILVFDKDMSINFSNKAFESVSQYIDESSMNEITELIGSNIKDNLIKIKKRFGNRFFLITIIKFKSIREGHLVILEDFTDVLQKRMVEMWQQMARKLAHELKNPLTPISLSIDRIYKKFTENDPEFPNIFKENTKIIKEEIKRLSDLISHFNKFAKLPPPQMALFNYKKFLYDVVLLYKDNINKDIKIDFSYNCKEEKVLGDELQLKQVYINLFTNAIEAIDSKGNINIKVECDEKFIYTYFKNDGPKISKENVDKIFEIYYSTKKTGSGLGLTMVKRIIEEHDGSIALEPNTAEGTCFKISLRRI